MADRQKMIAVCLSQAHSFLNTGFLSDDGSHAGQAETALAAAHAGPGTALDAVH